MKIDWIRKLTSRKFWLSVSAFVTLILTAAGKTEQEAAQVAALVMAGATVIGYVLAEGLADSATVIVQEEPTEEEEAEVE